MKKGCLTGIVIILVLALVGSCLPDTSTSDTTSSSLPGSETIVTTQPTTSLETTIISNDTTPAEENDVITTEQDDVTTEEAVTYEVMVWIPKTGSKYHQNRWCSNMKNPREVTLKYAKQRGYASCKRCH